MPNVVTLDAVSSLRSFARLGLVLLVLDMAQMDVVMLLRSLAAFTKIAGKEKTPPEVGNGWNFKKEVDGRRCSEFKGKLDT